MARGDCGRWGKVRRGKVRGNGSWRQEVAAGELQPIQDDLESEIWIQQKGRPGDVRAAHPQLSVVMAGSGGSAIQRARPSILGFRVILELRGVQRRGLSGGEPPDLLVASGVGPGRVVERRGFGFSRQRRIEEELGRKLRVFASGTLAVEGDQQGSGWWRQQWGGVSKRLGLKGRRGW